MALVPLQLSSTHPDFEALVLQLQLYLSQKQTWIDILTSSTGQTLIEMMAATGCFNQFAIESAAREAFLETAYRDSSIYAITRMLGVKITRKTPASTTAVLNNVSTEAHVTIPRFTEFQIGGRRFFNREPFFFTAIGNTDQVNGGVPPVVGSQIEITLYEGYKKVQTFAANSTIFREIYLSEPGFVVSNDDLDVYLVSPSMGTREKWNPTDQGIWVAEATDTVYYDSTSGKGDVILAFGDGNHGSLPSIGYNIEVNYVITTGVTGNVGLSGQVVSVTDFPGILGHNLSQITGGSDEKPSIYYKFLAPHLFRARQRAVTSPDYKAICSSYPGVASVTVQSQRDIAPNDLRWMNMVRICILPVDTDIFDPDKEITGLTPQWDDFEEWFRNYYHAAIKIVRQDPTKVETRIDITLKLRQEAVLKTAISQVDANVRSLFVKSFDTLGKRIAISDIVEASMVENVDYVWVLVTTDPNAPVPNSREDLVPANPLTYFSLLSLDVKAEYTERTFFVNSILANP